MKRLAIFLGIMIASSVAFAVTANFFKGLVTVRTATSKPTCATATGDGDLCVSDAIECNGALDVGGAFSLTGDLTLGGGAGALTSSANGATSWSIADNDSTALLIGSAGMPNLLTFDTATGTETIVINGTTGQDALHVNVGDVQMDEDLDVAGDLVVTGTITSGGVSSTYTATDDTQYVMGTGSDAYIEYDHAVQTVDTTVLGLSTDSRALLVIEAADTATDFTHAQQTNPTIFIQSANEADITSWISLAHNDTNGVLDVGKGVVTIPDGYMVTDQLQGCFGASSDACFEYDTSQTPDAFMLGVGTDSRTFVIAEKADMATDFGIAQQTNPTLVIHSADEATVADYIAIAHDQTNGLISTAAGDIVLQPEGDDVVIGTGEAGVDYKLGVNGESADGLWTYMEDEDRWDTTDGVKIDGTLTIAALAGTGNTGVGVTAANGANTACDTTCGASTCLVGFDTGGSTFVACGSNLADTCACLP